MKSFLQYIKEDFPVVSSDSGRRRYEPSTSSSTVIKKIGPYTLFHISDYNYGDDAYHIHHKGKLIGHVEGDHSNKGHIRISGPSLQLQHRGRKAKVRNLMPRVYAAIADYHGKPIHSGTEQTPGSQSIWRRLAKMRKVTAHTDGYAGKTGFYRHPVAGLVSGHRYKSDREGLTYYNRQIRSLSRKPPDRFRNHDLKYYTRKAKEIERKYGIKSGQLLPNLAGRRVSISSLIGSKRYIPREHEKMAYDPGMGMDTYLKLHPNKKRNK